MVVETEGHTSVVDVPQTALVVERHQGKREEIEFAEMVLLVWIAVFPYIAARIEKEDEPQQRVVVAEVGTEQKAEIGHEQHAEQREVLAAVDVGCDDGQVGSQCYENDVFRGKPIGVVIDGGECLKQAFSRIFYLSHAEEQQIKQCRIEEYRSPGFGYFAPFLLGMIEEVAGNQNVAVGSDFGETS